MTMDPGWGMVRDELRSGANSKSSSRCHCHCLGHLAGGRHATKIGAWRCCKCCASLFPNRALAAALNVSEKRVYGFPSSLVLANNLIVLFHFPPFPFPFPLTLSTSYPLNLRHSAWLGCAPLLLDWTRYRCCAVR